MAKYLLGLATLAFVYCAYLQLNDPDPLVWILTYGLAAVTSSLAAFEQFHPRRTVLYAIGLIAFGVAWLPSDVSQITQPMTAASPEIERAREAAGLLIAGFFMLGVGWYGHRRQKQQST